ncbi:MAG: membrane dipeptidase [Clostridia bacterium]|nr:membrane dipeptidase [Clostridia bacterium]
MIYDLHNDLLTNTYVDIKKEKTENSLAKNVIYALWTTNKRLRKDDVMRYLYALDDNDKWAIEDLSGILSFEEILDIPNLAYVSLTWNGENCYAGGVGVEKSLSVHGKRALSEMCIRDIPLDLSHLSDKAFFSAIDNYEKVFLSHTASRRLFNNSRLITDEMAKLVAKQSGIIGVFAVPKFLSEKKASRKDYLLHIVHFADLVGVNYVAIGTDFNGSDERITGLSTYMEFDLLRNEMASYGFTTDEINKIFFENAQRFFGSKNGKKEN